MSDRNEEATWLKKAIHAALGVLPETEENWMAIHLLRAAATIPSGSKFPGPSDASKQVKDRLWNEAAPGGIAIGSAILTIGELKL